MSEKKPSSSQIRNHSHFQDDEDTRTTFELRKRFDHLRRITRKQSSPHMRPHPGLQIFGDDYSEFQNLYSKDQLESLEKCFLMADHDRDGHLNAMELKYWMEKHNVPITEKTLNRILDLADFDKDGALSFREFLFLCKKMELKEAGNKSGHGGQTIFDCLEQSTHEDFDYQTSAKKTKSFARLRAEVQTNVKYFENRIAEELSGPKRQGDEEYLDRVREISHRDSDLNLQELFQNLRHPLQEIKEICNDRHVKTAYIVLENNIGAQAPASGTQRHSSLETGLLFDDVTQHESRKVEFDDGTNHISALNDGTKRISVLDDGTRVIIPVHPTSSHKFDDEYLSKNEISPIDHHNHGLENIVTKQETDKVQPEKRSHKIQTSYERFYGSNSDIKFIIPDLQEDFENLELRSPNVNSKTKLL